MTNAESDEYQLSADPRDLHGAKISCGKNPGCLKSTTLYSDQGFLVLVGVLVASGSENCDLPMPKLVPDHYWCFQLVTNQVELSAPKRIMLVKVVRVHRLIPRRKHAKS